MAKIIVQNTEITVLSQDEKEWRKDKIGKKLCEIYKKSSSSSFEDGFDGIDIVTRDGIQCYNKEQLTCYLDEYV